MTEPYYSKEWHQKNDDRKDFTYTPKVKQLQDSMCWLPTNPKQSDYDLADKILTRLIEENERIN